MPNKPTVNVASLIHEAFSRARDPRSAPYIAGATAALERQLNGTPVNCPHELGTAEADAFYAGMTEGHDIARTYTQEGSAA